MATMFLDPHDLPPADTARSAPHAVPSPVDQASAEPSRYGQADRRPLLLVVALVHAILLIALVKFDVLHVVRRPPHRLVVMELKPLAPPPPVAQPKPSPRLDVPKIATPVVAPPPIVSNPAPPPPIVAAPSPPPPSPQPVAAPAAPAIAAPIVPPDGMAANLGNAGPKYPIESRRKREEGTVRLRVLISAGGAVQEVAVARSSGFDRLDKAALDAVRRWKFKPGLQAGKPVEAVGFLSIPFQLT